MMSYCNMELPEEEYLEWLEELARQNQTEAAQFVPGVLLEDNRVRPASYWAERLLEPLYRLRLFPFQGETHWIGLSCGSWQQAERLPGQLARHCVAAAGLHGSFRGGVVIDLRQCAGEPAEGQLDGLESFLAGASAYLCPLILTGTDAAAAVRQQMELVDLQQILPQQLDLCELKSALESAGVTEAGKESILQRAKHVSSEKVAALLRIVRRQTVTNMRVDEAQLMRYLEPTRRTRREIGFGRELENETY